MQQVTDQVPSPGHVIVISPGTLVLDAGTGDRRMENWHLASFDGEVDLSRPEDQDRVWRQLVREFPDRLSVTTGT